MAKSSIDTKGKIFGLVAWVHILLVGIFSVLTTGKVNTTSSATSYLSFISSSHHQDNILVQEKEWNREDCENYQGGLTVFFLSTETKMSDLNVVCHW